MRILLAMAVVAVLATAASAHNEYYGTVTVNGLPIMSGTVCVYKACGELVACDSFTDGVYNVTIDGAGYYDIVCTSPSGVCIVWGDYHPGLNRHRPVNLSTPPGGGGGCADSPC